LTEGNIQATNYYVKQLLKPENYKRINFDLDFDRAGIPVPLDTKDDRLIGKMIKTARKYYQDNRIQFLKYMEDCY
jgi:hypothetical protein